MSIIDHVQQDMTRVQGKVCLCMYVPRRIKSGGGRCSHDCLPTGTSYIPSVVYPIHVMVRQRCGELGLVKTLWLQAG